MIFFITVLLFVCTQVSFGQLTTTIPLGRKCGCLDVPLTTNPQVPLVSTNLGYQNIVNQIANPLTAGNIGLLMSNGLPLANTPVTTALLNAIQLTKFPAMNNIQFSSSSLPICQEGITAGASITPNIQAVNFGNAGNIASIPNIGSLSNIGGLANIGLQFVPSIGNVNVPVRLRRNIQKNFGGLCNSAITYDSTLLGLY